MKKLNVLFGFSVFAALVAMAAVVADTRVCTEELDATLNVDFWNTTAHVNPSISYVSDSVTGLGIEVGTAMKSADCLGGGSLDARAVYDAKESASIRFSSQPVGLLMVFR